MVKKVGPRLRELNLAAQGSQSTVQRNLGTAFFTIARSQGDESGKGPTFDSGSVLQPFRP